MPGWLSRFIQLRGASILYTTLRSRLAPVKKTVAAFTEPSEHTLLSGKSNLADIFRLVLALTSLRCIKKTDYLLARRGIHHHYQDRL